MIVWANLCTIFIFLIFIMGTGKNDERLKDTQQRGKVGENFSIFRTVTFHPQSEICFSFQVKIPLTRNLFEGGIKPYCAISGSSNGEMGTISVLT